MMKQSKFMLFASLFEKKPIKGKEQSVDSSLEEEDEYRKLEYFWNECQPSSTEDLNIWAKTLQKIEKEGSVVEERKPTKYNIHFKSSVWIRLASLAAVVLIILVITLNIEGSQRDDLRKIAGTFNMNTDASEEPDDVTLIISEEKKIELKNDAKVSYANDNNVINVDQQQVGVSDAKVEYNQIIVPKGKRSQVILADKSRIWINSGTKVIYPCSFKGKYREIFVEGEAYLEVAKDAQRPFIVNTNGFEVQVLGTSFNVSAYRGSALSSIVLVEGSVEVKDGNKQRVTMIPNEMVSIGEVNGVAQLKGKKTVNAEEYISWIDGVLMMNGETLKDVLVKIGRYYGKTMICDTGVEQNVLYGKLFLNNQCEMVMKALESITLIKFEMRGDSIFVNGK